MFVAFLHCTAVHEKVTAANNITICDYKISHNTLLSYNYACILPTETKHTAKNIVLQTSLSISASSNLSKLGYYIFVSVQLHLKKLHHHNILVWYNYTILIMHVFYLQKQNTLLGI